MNKKIITAALFVLMLSGCQSNKALDSKLSMGAEIVTYAGTALSGTVLGSCRTEFDSGQKGRTNNLRLAAEKINGIIIMPGEIFSFNGSVGPTAKQNGFMKANVFSKGRLIKNYGGGVCQVSSTLYNACLEGGLEIVERHPHSGRVNYVPKNRDAATSYGGIDFKFKNNYNSPVAVNASVEGGSLICSVSRAMA